MKHDMTSESQMPANYMNFLRTTNEILRQDQWNQDTNTWYIYMNDTHTHTHTHTRNPTEITMTHKWHETQMEVYEL